MEWEVGADEGERFVAGVNGTFELGFFYCVEDGLELGSGRVTESDEVVAGEERGGADFVGGHGMEALGGEAVVVEVAAGGETIHAVEGEVLFEAVEAEEALEGGGFHARGVGEAHVVFDEGEDLGGFFVRESEATGDFGGDSDADLDVAVEADAVAGFGGVDGAEGGGLADVMEERAPGEGHGAAGLKLGEEHEGVGPDVALGVILGGLLDALEAGDFREDLGEEAGFVEELEGAASMALCQHAGEFVADTLAADGLDFGGLGSDGGVGGGVEGEAEACGEANGAEHAKVVFFEAASGGADGAEDAGLEVGEAAYVVEDGGLESGVGVELFRIEEEAVDGEVAALDVFLGRLAVADLVGVAAVGVCAVGAEGGDFGGGGLAFDFGRDEDDAEVSANSEGPGKEVEDDVWSGGGGDVVVFGGSAEEEVADAASGVVGLVAVLAQGGDDGESRGGLGCGGKHGASLRVRQARGYFSASVSMRTLPLGWPLW